MPVDRVATERSKRIEPGTVLVGRQWRRLLHFEVFLHRGSFIARRSDVLGDGPGEPQKIIGCVRAPKSVLPSSKR